MSYCIKHDPEGVDTYYAGDRTLPDTETVSYYYGRRYYCAILSRWISRDPIWEPSSLLSRKEDIALAMDRTISGENNDYSFVINQSISHVDFIGLSYCDLGCQPVSNPPISIQLRLSMGIGQLWYNYTERTEFERCGIECPNCGCGYNQTLRISQSGGGSGSWMVAGNQLVGGLKMGFTYSLGGTKTTKVTACPGSYTKDQSGCNWLNVGLQGEGCIGPSGLQCCLVLSGKYTTSDCPGSINGYSVSMSYKCCAGVGAFKTCYDKEIGKCDSSGCRWTVFNP